MQRAWAPASRAVLLRRQEPWQSGQRIANAPAFAGARLEPFSASADSTSQPCSAADVPEPRRACGTRGTGRGKDRCVLSRALGLDGFATRVFKSRRDLGSARQLPSVFQPGETEVLR